MALLTRHYGNFQVVLFMVLCKYIFQLVDWFCINDFSSASRVLFGEHQRNRFEQLEIIFKTTVLRQQRPVHIGRVFDTDSAELYANGGKHHRVSDSDRTY